MNPACTCQITERMNEDVKNGGDFHVGRTQWHPKKKTFSSVVFSQEGEQTTILKRVERSEEKILFFFQQSVQ